MKKYPIKQSPLYRLRNKTTLAKLLGLPETLLKNRISFDEQYIEFCKPKEHGDGQRRFSSPSGKSIVRAQKRLFLYLSRIEKPLWVKSASRGESYITNAVAHRTNAYGLKTDISSFYESVTFSRIRSCYLDTFEMAPDIAEIMTILSTHRRKLPTGAPASMLVAYFAYKKMFDSIYDYSLKQNISFTLYVDDLSFSSDSAIPKEFFLEVQRILVSYGLKAKWKKTKFYSKNEYKEYTGVGITQNGGLSVPNRMRKSILECYSKCTANPANHKELQRLQGKLNAARQIEPEVFPEIFNYLNCHREDLVAYQQKLARKV